MEHILQFGVTIDDHAIEERAVSTAAKAITEELKKQIFEKYYGTYEGLNSRTADIVFKFLENNKKEIIEESAEIIATKMYASTTNRKKIIEILGNKEENK